MFDFKILKYKKALMWSTLGRWIFGLALLLVLILLVKIFSNNLSEIWSKIADFLRFGG